MQSGAGILGDLVGFVGLGRRKRRVRGRGPLGDLWKKAKNYGISSLGKIHQNIKDTRSISRALGYNKNPNKSSVLGAAIHSLGYGRRRRVRGRGILGDIWNGAKKVAGYAAAPINYGLQKSKILSTILPGPAGTVAKFAGYGRRRVRRRMPGRGFFNSLLNPSPLFNTKPLADYITKFARDPTRLAAAKTALGLGRRRVMRKRGGQQMMGAGPISALAGFLGLGRRRRVRGRGPLGDLWKKAKSYGVDALKKIHQNVKDTRSISRALGYSKNPNKSSVIGSAVHSLGYGRVKRRRLGRGSASITPRMMGGSMQGGRLNMMGYGSMQGGRMMGGKLNTISF